MKTKSLFDAGEALKAPSAELLDVILNAPYVAVDVETDINGAPAHLCQSCEDKRTLETLWRMRAIYAGDDAEGALDRMYRAFPGLFERGVLPDAWFRMMRGEK